MNYVICKYHKICKIYTSVSYTYTDLNTCLKLVSRYAIASYFVLHGLLGFNLLNIYKSRIFLDDQIQQNIFRTKISLFTSSCQLWISKNTVIYFSFSVVLCTSQKVVRTSRAWLVSNQLMRGEHGELWPTRSVSLVDGFMSPLSDDFNSLLSTVKNISNSVKYFLVSGHDTQHLHQWRKFFSHFCLVSTLALLY